MSPGAARRLGLASATAVATLVTFRTLGAGRTTFELFVVVPAVFGLVAAAEREPRRRPALTAVAFLLAALTARKTWRTAQINWRESLEWDFLGFWLHARTALRRLDFYDPSNARELAHSLTMSDAFRKEIIDTGFWYPPPSMFLFAPLGWFDRRSALLLWFGLALLCLVGAVVLLTRLRLGRAQGLELLACATLVLACHGSASTAYFAQSTFTCLLALVLAVAARSYAYRGAWLAVAALVKPVAGSMLIADILGRRWRTLYGFVAAVAVAGVCAVVAFGAGPSLHYLSGADMGHKPTWIYSEPTNQSLLGLVLRTTRSECSSPLGCALVPGYLLPVLLLGGLTLFVSTREKSPDGAARAELWLLLGLIAYPVSQVFYSVLTVPAMMLLWQRRHAMPSGTWLAVGATTITLCLFSLDNGAKTIVGYLFLWCCLAASVLATPSAPLVQPAAPAPTT